MGTEFKIGDRVVVKSWKEMEAEFGLDKGGNINCPYTFMKKMDGYCEEVGIIKSTQKVVGGPTVVNIDFYRNNMNTTAKNWTFTTDMIKYATLISKEDWANSMYKKLLDDRNCFFMQEAPYTVVFNKATLKSAVAICHPDDDFDLKYGCAIAYARLTKVKIPNFENYRRLGDVGLFDTFKYGGSTYGIIGINRKTWEIYVYDVSTGNTNHYHPDTMVEVID